MAQSIRPFSIGRFAIFVAIQLVLLLLGLRSLFPTLWERQLASGPWVLVAMFLALHLFLCFFEWFFHRYMLHAVMSRWLSKLAQAHRHHHSLTHVRLTQGESGSDRVVLNVYPIIEDHQHDDAAFPRYALLAFWILFTPLLLGLQAFLSRLPVLVPGYVAIAWSMALYEILHAIAHRRYEWWQKATDHPRFGAFWRRLYGFHLTHHANSGCNEGISGFFGLPIADWCFGTYHQPKQLLLAGRSATAMDFTVGQPRAFIQRLDRWVRKRETAMIHGTQSVHRGRSPDVAKDS